MFRKTTVLLVMLLVGVFALNLTAFAQDEEDPGTLNIYSARHYGAMEGAFLAFEEATGIEVRISEGEPRDLLVRVQSDIENSGSSVADIFLSIDAGVLDIAAEMDLLVPVESEVLTANIPETLRDPDGYWFGLSLRPRTLVYNTENVTEEELAAINTYADLAAPEFEGRLCLRPASHIYTVSLTSSLLYHLGEDAATEIVEGWASNTTRYINSDTSIIKAVAAGECDFGLVNSYYVGRLLSAEDAAMETAALKWMNQGEDDFGVFFNATAAGIVKNAANYDNAVKFIEFMSSLEGQAGDLDGFPGSNFEFPVNPEAEVNEVLQTLGEVRFDTEYSLWDYGQYQEAATILLEEAGYGFEEN